MKRKFHCLLAALFLASCTKTVYVEPTTVPDSSVVTTVRESTTTTSKPPGASEALSYFEAYAEHSGLGYERMRELSAPLTPAWQYYFHQERLFIAATQAGTDQSSEKVSLEGNQIVVCGGANCASDIIYADFEFEDGLLSNFSIEGRNLSSLIQTWPFDQGLKCWTSDNAGCQSPKSVDVIFRSSYRTARNDLYVSFDWRRGDQASGTLRPKSAYLEVDGIRYESNGKVAPVPDKDRINLGYFRFPNPPSGAAKIVFLQSWDGQEIDFEFNLGRI